MIRKFKKSDTDAVMRLWLEGNTEAHSFIKPEYWVNNYDFVRSALESAEIYVYEQEGEPVGFAGISGGYIEGIFVDKSYRSRGIGRSLIRFLKEKYPALSLKVYKKNLRALSFYLREGFSVAEIGTDEDTEEAEFTLVFPAGDDRKGAKTAAVSDGNR